MRLSVVRGGGLAGMVLRTELDDAALPPEAAAELRARAGRAGLSAGASAESAPDIHPDEQLYEVCFEHEGVARTLRVTETTMSDPLRELLRWADARPEQTRTVAPPGG